MAASLSAFWVSAFETARSSVLAPQEPCRVNWPGGVDFPRRLVYWWPPDRLDWLARSRRCRGVRPIACGHCPLAGRCG